jgi:hypothetical protein
MKPTLLIALALSGGAVLTSSANTSFFVAPSFRGQPNADFAGWEVFTTATGLNNPDIAGSDAAATFKQNTVGAFLTGSGNIYAGPPPTVGSYTVSYDGAAVVDTVVFQVRTLGLELDYSSISLNYGSGNLGAPTRTELERAAAGGGPGAVSVSSSWNWNLTGLNATEVTITFNAAASDVSLDAAHLDVAAVPEPATWAMISGAGLLAFALWRRR